MKDNRKTDTKTKEEFKEKEVIGEYPITDKSKIVMKYVELGDSTFIDIRKFYLNPEDKWLPTAKGISIPYEIKDKIASDMNHFEDLGRINND